MENQDIQPTDQKSMTAQEAALLLSDTLTNLKNRRVTAKYARTISQIASTLVKVIETADLEERIIEIERRLDKQDTSRR